MDGPLRLLAVRDDPPATTTDPAAELLKLLQDPFSGQLSSTSIWASLGTSIGITAGIALAFSLLRPYNQVVYAPKVKHADEAHAPPPMGKGIFAWLMPLWKTTEADMVRHVGLDATLFMRFTRMLCYMFLVLSVLGVGILVPLNLAKNDGVEGQSWLQMLTPSNVFGEAHWGQVVVAYLFNAVICGFLWWNYRKVRQLRLTYFESDEYQHSLHARTLMLVDIPRAMCSDEGIARIIDEVAPDSSFSRTVIARNVKDLPSLIAQHAETVKRLEKVLAIYLKDPHNLPAARPTCRPDKKDPSYSTYPAGQKVDAIEYLTQRIRALEVEIREVRRSVDKRNAMPYGFASYADIAEAHEIAFRTRGKHPHGATLTLAPRPNDIIWDNLAMTPSRRSWRRVMVNLWIAALTLLWIAPNAMIAIFLVNLSNLGRVWPAFHDSLEANTALWGVVQGVASPALTSLIFLVLPIIFRRLSIRAGDRTKTGRERHVTAKLYAFFVFNNLVVFSIFNAIWTFVTKVIQETDKGTDAWQAIVKEGLATTVFISLCNISPFWVTWLLQRQLGAAIDLAQLWTLVYSFFMRKFSSPTPRELIELTAPPAFDYASYYNYFLFYSTVTLCYAGIQPLVLPAAALYFAIDVFLKKYLLLYIFVTKTESGGMFWRVLFNRFVFGTILANLVVFLTVWVRGDTASHVQAFAAIPLPFIMVAFKLYCARAFDDEIHYYRRGRGGRGNLGGGDTPAKSKERANQTDRLGSRFGHPALYKPLITPMVHARAQNILASVYQGRLTDGRFDAAMAADGSTLDAASVSGYSDTYAMDSMHSGQPGKSAANNTNAATTTKNSNSNMPGFELVPESRLDFAFYKNRDEFAAEHGGAGESLYGRRDDVVRPGTPGAATLAGSDFARSDSPAPGVLGGAFGGPFRPPTSSSSSAGIHTAYTGMGGAATTPDGLRGGGGRSRTGTTPLYGIPAAGDSGATLIHHAGANPTATPPGGPPPHLFSTPPHSRDASLERVPLTSSPAPAGGGVSGGPGGGGFGAPMRTGSPAPMGAMMRTASPAQMMRTASPAQMAGMMAGPPPPQQQQQQQYPSQGMRRMQGSRDGSGTYGGLPQSDGTVSPAEFGRPGQGQGQGQGYYQQGGPQQQQQQQQREGPQDPAQYDYFRAPRSRKSGGW